MVKRAPDERLGGEGIQTMGGLSQTESNLSQFRNELDLNNNTESSQSNISVNKLDNSLPYNELKPLFDEVTRKVNTMEELEKCYQVLEKLSFDLTASKINSIDFDKNDTLFLGQEYGLKRQESRKLFRYERVKRKRKYFQTISLRNFNLFQYMTCHVSLASALLFFS